MPAISNLHKCLLLLLFLAVAALHLSSSGGIRFGGEEDESSGFGGTGRMPAGGSGLGGTGLRPYLGDSGEVQIRFQPEAILIADQVADEDIRRLPPATTILPPVAVVTTPGFAAEKPAEVAITDAIQLQLNRDAVVYERILDSLEGYLPESASLFPQEPAAAPEDAVLVSPGEPAPEVAILTPEEPISAPAGFAGNNAGDSAPDPATLTWAALARYLAENSPAQDTGAREVSDERSAAQRPNRIRRPDLPPVQRGRLIQRPAILPPRVQPMRF